MSWGRKASHAACPRPTSNTSFRKNRLRRKGNKQLYTGSFGYILALGLTSGAFFTGHFLIVPVCIFAFIAAHAISMGAHAGQRAVAKNASPNSLAILIGQATETRRFKDDLFRNGELMRSEQVEREGGLRLDSCTRLSLQIWLVQRGHNSPSGIALVFHALPGSARTTKPKRFHSTRELYRHFHRGVKSVPGEIRCQL